MIYDVQSLGGNTVIAIGAGTTILRSTNGGGQWSQQFSVSDTLNTRLRGMYFRDALTGWAVGSAHLGFSKTIILKTTDGGLSWNSATNGANGVLWDIGFANENVGFTVGEGGKIFRTTNGGTTWTALTSGTTSHLYSVLAVSDSVAMVFGIGGMRKTTNGGATWTSLAMGGSQFPNIYNAFFFNKDSGYVVGQSGAMFKTTDKGENWSQINTGSTSGTYDGVYFVNATHGWITRGTTSLRRTTNGGQNWISSNMPVSISRTFLFSDTLKGFAFTATGQQYRTTDAGVSWVSVSGLPSVDFYQTYFVDKLLGYAVGDGETILKTTNGGGTWTQLRYTASQLSYESVFFVNASTGWAGGEGGTLVKTTDGGATWSPQTSQVFGRIKSLYFTDANNGWLSSDNGGGISRTTDGGATWVKSTVNGISGVSLLKISVPDGKTGYSSGEGQSIFKTIDSGATWNKLSSIANVQSMSVLDTATLFVSTYTDSVLKSTTGGATWEKVAKNSIYRTMMYIHFVNANEGYGVGWGSTANLVSRTTDGGKTWAIQPTPNGEGDFVHIFVIDSANAWIASGDGIILGRKPSIPTRVIMKAENVPTDFVLSQNYPNPFNPTTTVDFQLPASGPVSLTVFDALGREVAVLVNGWMNAGSYSASFSGKNLASGIYFYRLKAGNSAQTKKMMLLK